MFFYKKHFGERSCDGVSKRQLLLRLQTKAAARDTKSAATSCHYTRSFLRKKASINIPGNGVLIAQTGYRFVEKKQKFKNCLHFALILHGFLLFL